MAFDSLTEKLGEVFKKLRGKGKVSESDVAHIESVLRRSHGKSFFMGRLVSRDNDYLIERKFFLEIKSRIYMAHMNRIETSSVNTDFHWFLLF